MELDLLDKKIRRLVCKLKKHNIDLEVFDHRDIEYGQVIGKGGEGIVYQCTVIYNDMPIDAAVKVLQDNSDDAVSITLDEIELLCLARDHVIDTTLHVYGVAAVPEKDDDEIGKLVLITEAGIMNALQLYQNEDMAYWVTFDLWSRIAGAVNTMHIRHIVHQDLKPENILIMDVVRDLFGYINKIKFKVIDLGMGKRVFTEKIISDDILGTNGYHAPEVLTEESYDFRSDIFTLGITFCVMLQSSDFLKSNKLQAFLKQLHAAKKKGMTGKVLFQQIIEPTFPEDISIPNSIRTMLWRMLEKQEKRKITLIEVMNLCRLEAICSKDDIKVSPRSTSPCTNCSDSGISSMSHVSCRQPPSSNPSSVASRSGRRHATRATRASRSRNSSVSSSHSSRETTPYVPYIKTRTQKRKVSLSNNREESSPTVKRPRRHCSTML